MKKTGNSEHPVLHCRYSDNTGDYGCFLRVDFSSLIIRCERESDASAFFFATIPMSRVGFDQVPVEEWEKLMRVNVTGTWFCCRAVAPYMKKQRSGKIVNISSGSIYSGTGKRIHYVTSKAAIIGFTRTLARELGDDNICVNALAPGSTLSEKPDDPKALEHRKQALGKRCLKKIQYPEDLVGVMVFLCSDAAEFMSGQTMVVDGGAMMI